MINLPSQQTIKKWKAKTKKNAIRIRVRYAAASMPLISYV